MRYERDMRGYGANPPDPKWPGGAHVAVQFVVNYEEGGENCVLRLFIEAEVPVTCYGVATALARSPDQVAAMQEAGWEIASHGLRWIDYRDHAPEDERRDMEAAIQLHYEVTGARPAGWY
ncbi:MAG: polysaccharide deacetylase, partial [Mesorhizobium sp.]